MKSTTLQNRKKLAHAFDALGHHRRIAIVQALQEAGKSGIIFGDLAQRAGMPESALKHHIRMIRRGGFLRTRTKGNFTVLRLDVEQLNLALTSFGRTHISNETQGLVAV